MIVDEKIQIKVAHKNVSHFRKFGYKCNVNDLIFVSPFDIPKASEIRINVICQNCNKIKNISNNNYINKQLPKYGFYVCSDCGKVKRKMTINSLYGVDYYSQHEDFIIKSSQTNQKNWGVDNFRQSKEYLVRAIKTTNSKYGVDYFLQNKKNYQAFSEKILNKYGVDNISKINGINYEKRVLTNIERYGAEHAMQNSEVFQNSISKSFRKNKFFDLYYQSSYEKDFILYCAVRKIILERGPTIEYVFNKKRKVYYSDFYLPEYNLVCEIKSDYIYNKAIEINEKKMEYTLKEGYNFLFIVNKNYIEFDNVIKNNIEN